ncbi:MAG: hypothetical protein HYY45_16405 [Deltaproteobacteria bacterium]|nr:hypothetical protein [Deltaproteobacteria bacterium]
MEMPQELGSPERLAGRVAGRLRRHLWWDTLLASFPPLFAVTSLGVLPYSAAWKPSVAGMGVAAVLAASAFVIGLWRARGAAASVGQAARLIDQKVAGQERFVTLATMDPSACSPFLVSRLRDEAADLARRLNLERDFPYRIKRSFFQSLILSLSAILLFLLIPQIALLLTSGTPGHELMRSARQLSRVPGFSELARKLEALAARLREPGLTDAEKRALVRELLAQLERPRNAERQPGGAGSELLDQAGDALRRLEQGLERGEERGGNGSGDQSARGEKSGGESGRSETNEGRGEASGLASKEPAGKEPGPGDKRQPDKKRAETGLGNGEGNEKDKSREAKRAGKEESGDKGSRNPGEEIPTGKAAERFLKPGEEGEKGIKGARFVTVQLPEEEIASETGQGGSGKRRELRPKTPVSNVPLRRPDAPDASPEKQPLPLEYRGLIR